jgi:hypothetical protein
MDAKLEMQIEQAIEQAARKVDEIVAKRAERRRIVNETLERWLELREEVKADYQNGHCR